MSVEKAKIRTFVMPKVACVITSWTLPSMQNFTALPSGVFFSAYASFSNHFQSFSLTNFSVILGFFNKATAHTLNGFYSKKRRSG